MTEFLLFGLHDVMTSAYVIVTLRTAVPVDPGGNRSGDETTASYTAKSRVHMPYVMLTLKVKPALV